jgi:hypothetical protein
VLRATDDRREVFIDCSCGRPLARGTLRIDRRRNGQCRDRLRVPLESKRFLIAVEMSVT